jgi:hypothetical protein
VIIPPGVLARGSSGRGGSSGGGGSGGGGSSCCRSGSGGSSCCLNTVDTITFESVFTFTLEATRSVGAYSVLVTVVFLVRRAFIDIYTYSVLFDETIMALACESTISVVAVCVITTNVTRSTFIYISAGNTVTRVTIFTSTFESTAVVTANGVVITVVLVALTLIDVETSSIFLEKAVHAAAGEATDVVFAV